MTTARDVDIPPAIAVLIAQLPRPGELFPMSTRHRFLAAIAATLDLLYGQIGDDDDLVAEEIEQMAEAEFPELQ